MDTTLPPALQRNQFILQFSQQIVQEIIYGIFASGLLCIDVSKQSFDFLADILKVSNFQSLVPALGETDSNGDFVWQQDGHAEVLFAPADVPFVKVLGNEDGCFPNGDVVGPGGMFSATRGGLEIIDAATSCPENVDRTNFDNTYDLLIYFPNVRIEVSAPDADGNRVTLFRAEWDVALSAAVEYSVLSRGTTFGGTVPKFFEILVDGFMGCDGDIFGGDAFTGNVPGFDGTRCDVQPIGVAESDISEGISSFLLGIINASFSTAFQTKLFLGGLDADFFKIGFGDLGNPEGLSPMPANNEVLDTDPNGTFGDDTPDYLVGGGRFSGSVDFASLINLLGGLTAPGNEPVGVETFVGLPELELDSGFRKASATARRLFLSPRQSYEAGFTEDGGMVTFGSQVNGLVPVTDDVDALETKYSYRLNGGFWRPYRSGDGLQLPPLPSGRHVLEVKARGPLQLIDEQPAQVVFYVDGVAPTVRLYDDENEFVSDQFDNVRATSRLQVRATDNVSESSLLTLEYAFNGSGEWREVIGGKIELEALSRDEIHTVRVRARDEFGNVGEAEATVKPQPGAVSSFGCTATDGGSPAAAAVALLLMVLAWFGLRGRRATPERAGKEV